MRAVLRYAARYRSRYLIGFACLAAGTGFSLAIPWTVKRAIDALERDAAAAPLGALVALIIALAIANGIVRLATTSTPACRASRPPPSPSAARAIS